MYHFFITPDQMQGKRAFITGKDVAHISLVLRMKPGEMLLISTGEDWDYLCKITAITPEQVELAVTQEHVGARELPSRVFLLQGLPKGDKMEDILKKSIELGVYQILPVITKRCIVRLEGRKKEAKRQRWQAIAEGAAKQSNRSLIPQVQLPVALEEALEQVGDLPVKLMPYEKAQGMDQTRKILGELKPGEDVAVLIGPEGGFEEEEVKLAQKAGFIPITLGRRILRTETAGVALLGNIMFRLEE